MTKLTPGDIMANGVRIRYYRIGADKPPLLIAHGVTDNALCWTRMAGALQHSYDVILYDERGHGLSAAPQSGYSFRDNAEDLAGLISALGLERPHIIGHSGGGAAAALLAATYADLPASLVLEDPPWGSGWGEWDELAVGMRQWFLGLGSMTREVLIASCRESYPEWPAEEAALWAESKLQVNRSVVQSFDQPAPAWRETLPQIKCPILFISGDVEKGAVNTAEDIAEYAAVWRQGRALRIAGAGHVVHTDRFEAYAAAVKAFLAEVDGG